LIKRYAHRSPGNDLEQNREEQQVGDANRGMGLTAPPSWTAGPAAPLW